MLVIPQFERLATVSTTTYGGDDVSVIVVREDVDRITGQELHDEADRVARLILKGGVA